jgi:peptidoglycan hydrolase-like protein with peptidoglycan-binding domain/protocatechuate 3,4-dioxygenase beta subunit
MQTTSSTERAALNVRVEELKAKQQEILNEYFKDRSPTPEEQVILDRIDEKIRQLIAAAESTGAAGDEGANQSSTTGQVNWSIKATVTDFEGAPAVGVEVRVMGPNGMSMTSDSRGEALFEMAGTGRYAVQAFRDENETDPEIFIQNEPTEGEVLEAALQLHGAPSAPFEAPSEVNEPTMRAGDEDPDGWVEYLQKMLNHHLKQAGEPKIPVSGNFDSATDQAVRWFQGATECKVDGIVGNQTWSALREDKVRDEIGTDGRQPGTHSEQGAEGRWTFESGDLAFYEEEMDLLRFAVASTGTDPISEFRADIFVDGSRQQVPLGDPVSSTGGQDIHVVFVTRFRERFGDGPFEIKAYLPQELGGDLWENTVEIPPADGPSGEEDAEWSIEALVQDQDGNALAEAEVRFDGPAGFTGVTDSEGRTRHDVMGAGRYELTATLDGKASRKIVVEEADPEDGTVRDCVLVIDLSPGDGPQSDLDVPWVITAIVTDTEGNPLVEAGIDFSGPLGFSGVTDNAGRASHEVQGPSRYELTATLDGKESRTQVVEEVEPDDGEVRECELVIDLSGGDTPTENLQWIIDVLVQDTEGNPLNDAGVTFDGPSGFSGATDASGHVRHEVEGPSRYEMVAEFEGKASQKVVVEESEPEEGEVRDAVLTIDLSGGGDTPETDASWTIDVTVHDQDGNPLDSAGVEFKGPTGFNGATDGSGHVTHEIQGAGRYEVKASFEGKESRKVIVEEIEPEEGEVRECELEIDLSGGDGPPPETGVTWTIEVTVKDTEGNAVSMAGVRFDGPTGFNGITDSSGVATHTIQGPGHYSMKAFFGNDESDTQVIDESSPKGGSVHRVELTIDLSGGETPDPVNDVRWLIHAVVKDQNGDPVQGAAVGFDGPIGFTGFTDSAGLTSHEVQGPGQYEMQAIIDEAESNTEVIDEDAPKDGMIHEVELIVHVEDPTEEEEEEEDGNPLLADVEIEIGNELYGSITAVFDKDGKFTGINLEKSIVEKSLAGGADGLIAGGAVKISGALEGRMKGNKLTIKSVLAASGSIKVGLGVAAPRGWLGVGVEFSLKFARTIESVTVDFDRSVLENAAKIIKAGGSQPTLHAAFGLPAKYVLSAKYAFILGGGSSKVLEGKISKKIKGYDPMIIIELSATDTSVTVTLDACPGVYEFLDDIAHLISPVSMGIIDELLQIADDPDNYVDNKIGQVESTVDRISELHDDLQDHFSEEIDFVRGLLD